jgi:hypothetical protein
VNFDEILYVDDDIKGDLDSILLYPTAPTIPKWWTFKLLRWALLLNRVVELDEILYGIGDVEYCLLQAYVGKVGILVLPRTSRFISPFIFFLEALF